MDFDLQYSPRTASRDARPKEPLPLAATLSVPYSRTTLQDAHPVEPLTVAATLSAPYSGTTLFAILLARHSQLSSDGETFPQEEDHPVTCTCGKLQIDCPYYRQAAAHMLSTQGNRWHTDLFAPHPVYSRFALVDKAAGTGLRSLVPGWRRQDQNFVAAHLRFMENSLRLRQARIYVDGCKSIRRALLFAGRGRFRMKILHLVRDGRGFCFSYLKNRALPRTRLARAARAWLKEINAVDHFQAR